MVKVGDVIPSGGKLEDGNPGAKVDFKELCTGKKVVLVGVPGAFTPTCSNQHAPNIIANAEALKQKGVGEIVIMSVNDAFVMDAWSKDLKAEGKVRCLADPQGLVTEALGLTMPLKKMLGTDRCKRFAMLIEDGVVKHLRVQDENGAKMEDTCAEPILAKL